MDMHEKVELYTQLDKLQKDRDKELEVILLDILPEAFAVVKETAAGLPITYYRSYCYRV
jgi:preprotein translocase subunit SecA